ncbi:MAG: STAS/SEC14 domain-containing protein [Bacteroidota bacterium]
MSPMKLDFKILPEHGLIVEVLSGRISGNDLIEFKKRVMAEKEYQYHFDVLVDLRKVQFASVEDIVDTFFGFYKHYFQFMGNKKSAYITRMPLQVAIMTLYGERIKSTPMDIRIFSTPEAAVKWLDLSTRSESFYQEVILSLPT